MSKWNFEVADTDALFDLFRKAVAECENCLDAKLPIPAYEQAIKASHVFNLLQARGVISVAERQAYIGRVRDLAKGAARRGWQERVGRREHRSLNHPPGQAPREAGKPMLASAPPPQPAPALAGWGTIGDRFPARTALARKSPRGCRTRRATISRGCSPPSCGKAGLVGGASITTYADAAPAGADRARPARRPPPCREEIKGPRVGAPPQALEGFLRKTGLTREQLVERDGVLFAVIDKPGRATADVLAEAIPAIVRAFPWPKSMRWGAASRTTESLRWVRPLQGIVALLGEDVVPFEIAGIHSGAATLGHRFHHPGAITIGWRADYAENLRACHVIVDQDERARSSATRATRPRREAGLALVEDEGLVAENAGLTEWPVPLLGRFDADFLEVPPEVIQLTARVNQKYFVCRDSRGQARQRLRLHRQYRRGGRRREDRRGQPQGARRAAVATRGSSTRPT